MAYFMNDVMGGVVDQPDETQIRDILAELTNADDEHPDISLVHESGWSLSVFRDKVLTWENVEDPAIAPRETSLTSWDDVVDLLLELAHGHITEVDRTISRMPNIIAPER
ncbi:MAG: hypothetical protein ACRDP3_17820 [Streptomyces sp.]|uniref:hypothetical protein n=1 Tax=Streptomyces sp. TaxID=1931 RepID=UPI003D6C6F40